MFRFTIRELVLLTLVVAMGIGWWLDRQAAKERGAAVVKHAARLRNSLEQARVANVELEVMTLEYAEAAQKKLDLDHKLLQEGRDPRRRPYRILPEWAVDWAILNEEIPQL